MLQLVYYATYYTTCISPIIKSIHVRVSFLETQQLAQGRTAADTSKLSTNVMVAHAILIKLSIILVKN